MTAKNWCFTFNDATGSLLEGESLLSITSALSTDYHLRGISYYVFQLERGAEGTLHLQGYLQFGARRSLAAVRRTFQDVIPNAHWEKSKGTAQQCRDYCTKDETRVSGPWEGGEISKKGKRSDLDEFMTAMKDGMTEDEMYDRFPSIVAKYPRFVKDVDRRRRRVAVQDFVPRDGWQTELFAILHSPAHSRRVHWYSDATGNSGKSYFAGGFGRGIGYVVTGGKHADIFYAYNYQPVVFFDWPRSSAETFPYGVVEAFKNGYFLSTKYESCAIRFPTPHVIILANFLPDETKLSSDRWIINHI